MDLAIRAPLRLRLCSKLSTSLSLPLTQRQITTTTSTSLTQTKKTAPQKRDYRPIKKHLLVRRFVPEEIRKYVTPDGKLLTTERNEAFFLDHDLEPDNGTMVKLAGKNLGKLASQLSTTIAFSPKHVISPYDLRYFDPRGHPLAGAVRQRYAEQAKSTPLWIMTTVTGGSAVVRASAKKKLKRAITTSLAKLGYDQAVGLGQERQIKGTLWLTIHNPVAAVALNGDAFGAAVANHLHSQLSKAIR